MPAQENCHIWDRAKGGPDVFGNLLRACAAHHHEHTAGRIQDHDLRVIKARLAWANDRYTGSEYMWLQIFAQRGGVRFQHPLSKRSCLRFLESDGYVQITGASQAVGNGRSLDDWHLTEIGQWFAKAWAESGAFPVTLRFAR
ncbi:hypothetical protein GCM10018987_24070 [Streptomyces cremeus]